MGSARHGFIKPVLTRCAAVGFSLLLAVSLPLGFASLQNTAYADPSTAEKLASAQQQAADASARLQELESELNVVLNELGEIQDNKAATETAIEETEAAIVVAQGHVDEATTTLNNAAVAQYRRHSSDFSTMLQVLTSSGSMDEIISGLFYAQRINEQQKNAIDGFVAARTELEVQEATLVEEKAQLEVLEAAAIEKQGELEASVATAQAYYDGLSAEVQELLAQKAAEDAAAAATRAAAADQQRRATDPNYDEVEIGDNTHYDAPPVRDYSSVVDAAQSRIGCPYVAAAAGPDSFDCSGLVMWCYEQRGISLPHYSGSQYSSCYIFDDESMARPGDIVFFGPGGSKHVGIYVGGGSMIHSPYTGATVCYGSIDRSDFAGFGRP